MINLLPLEEKQKLLAEKKEKLTKIWGIIILVFLVSLILILLSIKFYILTATDLQKYILAQTEKKYQTDDFTNLNNTIGKYNKILSQLDSFYKKEVYFSHALDLITGVQSPKDLYLNNFSIIRDAKGKIQVSLSGASESRDDLLVFKKNIEQSSEISNLYFSPESWINQKNVVFSLTFEFKPNLQNEK